MEAPIYLLHFRKSRGKSCPRFPLLLDLLREIFTLLFHTALMSLKLSGFTAAERQREHNRELYPATDSPAGKEEVPKALCRLECLEESCLRVWFKSGTHTWLCTDQSSWCQPSQVLLGCWLMLLHSLHTPPALHSVLCLSEAHPWHRSTMERAWVFWQQRQH